MHSFMYVGAKKLGRGKIIWGRGSRPVIPNWQVNWSSDPTGKTGLKSTRFGVDMVFENTIEIN